MRILLCTDGSAHSLAAARWLAGHACDLRDTPTIQLFHVHPPLPYARAGEVVGRTAVKNYQRETSEEALAPAAKVLHAARLAFHSAWAVGDVANEIADFTEKGAFDLVVMGTHGNGALLNLTLGSVATQCIARLTVPVVVVPRARANVAAAR